ncbi:MAG: right-handed parallel beta-helix repeat-containing protein, partial [Anaerolineae bacterium]|nr:right-handed parallel beta-helix repeat-containing protein [Anaerolineae bacterium]
MKSRLRFSVGVGLPVLWLVVAWLLLGSGTASAGPRSAEMEGTSVGGNIITHTTWSLAGSPYVLQTQNVTVVDGVTLTIEPGVTVELNAARVLYVNGTLAAVGTPTRTITFTRMPGATSPWGMIQLGGGTVLTDSNATQISYATLEGGGSAAQMLYAYHSAPALDHVTLRNSSTRGLCATSVPAGSALTWDAGTVTGCAWEGIYVTSGRVELNNLSVSGNTGDGIEFSSSAHDSQLLDSILQGNGGDGIRSSGSDRLLMDGLTIGPNTGYGIYTQSGGANSVLRDTTVQGNAVAARLHPDTALENVTWSGNTRSEIEWTGGQVYTSRTWRRFPEISTYRMLADITVRDNAVLSVEPGVAVQVAEYVSLRATGGLSAVGTISQPITFTLLPGATHPWGMIEIGGGVQGDSDDSRISYATVEGGGYGGKLVHIYYSSTKMDHVTVCDSSSVGIQVTPFAGTQVTLDTVAVTDSAGVAIYHPQPGPSLVYRDLTLQGNGTDAVSIAGGSSILSPMQWDLADAGVPVRVGALSVYGGGVLALMPGSRLEFASTAGLEVWFDSGFYAMGTPEEPITLTGALPQPGAWKGVWLHPRSSAILYNSIVDYGGAAGEPALKIQSPEAAVIVNSAIRHAAGDGIYVDTATPPLLSFNEVSGNGFGVRNNRPAVPVDARQVWWGDVTGPQHTTLNPGGLGNAVSDGVLFAPWLTSVPTGTVPASDLIVETAGPRALSPGESAVFGATYLNATAQDLHDAVLVLALPDGASFVEAYPALADAVRGVYWAERHHVFWRLGTVSAGTSGMVAARVRFPWGLPAATDSFMAMMGDPDSGLAAVSTCGMIAPFDVLAYLNHTAIDILSTTVLTPTEVDAERQAYQAVDYLFTRALEEGYVLTTAERYTITGGRTFVRIVLDRPDDLATTHVVRVDQVVHAHISDGSSFILRTVMGDVIYDRATAMISFTGMLGIALRSTALDPVADRLLYAGFEPGIQQIYPAIDPDPEPQPPDYYQCYGNCLSELDQQRVRNWMSLQATGVLGLPRYALEDLWLFLDEFNCHPDCDEDPMSHFCQAPITYCGGSTRIYAKPCDFDTGRYEPGEKVYRRCSGSD